MKRCALACSLMAAMFCGQAKAASDWPFWNRYAARFITPDGRVVDPDRNSMTTSEGQSYALFFALVANDHATFERLRMWTEGNLSHGDLAKNLPAWSWGHVNDGSWGVLDQNSAADADLWIAYDLIGAGRLWNKPEYDRQGRGLLAMIAKEEVTTLPDAGPVLMPGKISLFSSSDHWTLNPSYSPLPLLVASGHAAPDGPWTKMAAGLPVLLAAASPTGFAMDWVGYTSGKGLAPENGPGDAAKSPRGSYDAIRVYLWAGLTDKATPGVEKVLETFAPMAHLMRDEPGPPEAISANGMVLSRSAPAGFSAALVPFLMSSGDKVSAGAQQKLFESQFDRETGLLGNPARYYDQNLALFALGWLEQRFRFAPDGTLRVQWKK